MSNRRTSSRARKQVDYSHSEKDFEDDDDFANNSGAAAKRLKAATKGQTTKQVVKQPARSKKEVDNKVVAPIKSTERRLPLDEKLFERDLQKAMQLSSETDVHSHGCAYVESDDKATNDKNNSQLSQSTQHIINQLSHVRAKDSDADYDDKQDTNNDDDDGDADENDDNYSEASDSSDSEFGSSKTKRSKVTGPKTKMSREMPSKSSAVVPMHKTPVAASKSTKTCNKNSNKRSPATTTTSRDVCSLKSPTTAVFSSSSSPSSGLRLGLSRNVKVKPLHRSLHVVS